MAFESLSDKLNATFKKLRGKGRLTELDISEAMREVRLALLEADVSYKVVKDFVKRVTERAKGAEVMESLTPAQMVVKIVNEELRGSWAAKTRSSTSPPSRPTRRHAGAACRAPARPRTAQSSPRSCKKQGKRPLLVACDVYRPAAIKQLEVVGEQLGIPVFQMGQDDPVEIAKAAIAHAKKLRQRPGLPRHGRPPAHRRGSSWTSCKNIKAATCSPTEILLVVDAMTGQDAVNAATAFDEALDIDGVMLTKLDGDARGGAALSVTAVTGKPIKFVGMGEKLDQIEPFHPDRMAWRILGMGDVLTLIEKAEQTLDEKKAAEMSRQAPPEQLHPDGLPRAAPAAQEAWAPWRTSPGCSA